MDLGGHAKVERKGIALVLLCVAQFVDVLDVNAVIVALHSIGQDFGFSQADLQWVVSAYVLFFAGFLLLSGRVADLWGRGGTFIAGLSVFTAASLSCGLSVSPEMLVVSRALQGLGAAITAPAALSIITTIFAEGRERDRAVAAWTAVAAGGGAAGLLLGGLITDVLGWEWIFFVNVPFGVASIALSRELLPRAGTLRPPAGWIFSGPVRSPRGWCSWYGGGAARNRRGGLRLHDYATATLGFAAAFFGAFVFVERRAADPLVPLKLFRLRELVGAALVAFALTAATAPVGVLVTLYLQNTLGYSASIAGLAGLPFSFCVIAGSMLGGRISERIGGKATMSSGLAVVAVSALITAGITADGGVAYVLAGAGLSGLGCASVASTARGTSAVEEGKRGLASGFMNTSAQVGTALGLATLLTLAATCTAALSDGAESAAGTLVAGYRLAFLVAASIASLGVVAALNFFRHYTS